MSELPWFVMQHYWWWYPSPWWYTSPWWYLSPLLTYVSIQVICMAIFRSLWYVICYGACCEFEFISIIYEFLDSHWRTVITSVENTHFTFLKSTWTKVLNVYNLNRRVESCLKIKILQSINHPQIWHRTPPLHCLLHFSSASILTPTPPRTLQQVRPITRDLGAGTSSSGCAESSESSESSNWLVLGMIRVFNLVSWVWSYSLRWLVWI